MTETIVEGTNTFSAWLGTNWYWVLLGTFLFLIGMDTIRQQRSAGAYVWKKDSWSWMLLQLFWNILKIAVFNKIMIVVWAVGFLVAMTYGMYMGKPLHPDETFFSQFTYWWADGISWIKSFGIFGGDPFPPVDTPVADTP